MPDMANITVKKNDGTTDSVYTKQTASAGDKTPAVWRGVGGTAPAHQPEFTLASQWNGPRTARRLNSRYVFPAVVVGTDGKSSIADRAIMEVTWIVPQGMAQADINEFAAQGTRLNTDTLVRSSVTTGFAPT